MYIGVWVIVVVIDGRRRKGVERVDIRVIQIYGCSVSICEHTCPAGRGRLDAMQKLDMGRLPKIQKVRVEAQVTRRVRSVDCVRYSSDYYVR